MSTSNKLFQAASGGAGESVYVDDVFSTYLYDGIDSAALTIDNGIALNDEGGMIWFKARNATENHCLYDTERGPGKVIFPDTNGAQLTNTGANKVEFRYAGATGFQTGTSYGGSENGAGKEIVSWTFRKQAGFFDVVTYTGTGTGTGERTINHNLGSTPGVIILKDTSAAGNWIVYHRDGTNSGNYKKNLVLNNTNEESGNNFWVNAGITATTFRFNDQFINMNVSGRTYVAYLFAHDDQQFGDDSDESIIKCGSYTGNGSSTGPSVDLGFEPQWLLIKGVGDSDWIMLDVMRGIPTGSNDARLRANSGAETSTIDFLSVTSTGFDIATNNVNVNTNGTAYTYIAIRRPMKTPTAGTEVFAVDTYNQTSASDPAFNLGGVVDFGLRRTTTESNWTAQARLTGDKGLVTNATDAESTKNYGFWDNMVGWHQGASITPPYSQSNSYGWSFKRASGFMDVVAYSGTGVAGTVNHNLGVVPELMIVKCRTDIKDWGVYNSTDGAEYYTQLNSSGAKIQGGGGLWNDTTPTETVFSVGAGSDANASGETYIAYLFATLAGVSKVGSYTGTGSDLNVDCGFSAGARFILIKRTDSTGDWYVWDSVRGIVAGNDPYLLLNSTAVEVTNTDYIDPLNAGFTVTSSAPVALNASGGTYIFLAIA